MDISYHASRPIQHIFTNDNSHNVALTYAMQYNCLESELHRTLLRECAVMPHNVNASNLAILECIDS